MKRFFSLTTVVTLLAGCSSTPPESYVKGLSAAKVCQMQGDLMSRNNPEGLIMLKSEAKLRIERNEISEEDCTSIVNMQLRYHDSMHGNPNTKQTTECTSIGNFSKCKTEVK